MFKKPLDFKRLRSGKEAFGFYLVQLLLALLAGGVVSAFYAIAVGSNAFLTGLKIGSTVAGLWSLVASFMVIRAHKTMGNVWYFVLAILSGLVGLLGGGVIGLIIPAYLTTRKK